MTSKASRSQAPRRPSRPRRATGPQNHRHRGGDGPKARDFTDDEKQIASKSLEMAFAIAGLAAGGKPICPICGEHSKLSVSPSRGTWACHHCRGRRGVDERGRDLAQGDAIALLTRFAGFTFRDAVLALLGRPADGARRTAKKVEVVIDDTPDFEAVLDTEVYSAVLAAGSVEAAQEYYGRWHIAPDVVEGMGAVMITDVDGVLDSLIDLFGIERLVNCGLFKDRSAAGKDPWPMLNRDYPVVEPHLTPSGRPLALQFRPSYRQERKIAAHKASRRKIDAALAADGWTPEKLAELDSAKVSELEAATGVPKANYVPKFLSLVGAQKGLVGCNLPQVADSPNGVVVYVVEGFKDGAAGRTMGAVTYAMPGVGAMPPPKVCEFFRKKDATLVLSLDGDDAGAAGQERLEEYLASQGVSFRHRSTPLPDGMDVTDVLVARHAEQNCDCRTCVTWRRNHP